MKIYELAIDDNNATQLEFPLEEERELFLILAKEKVSNFTSVTNDWEEFLLLKKEPKIDVDFYDIEDIGVCIVSQRAYELLLPILDNSVEILKFKSDEEDFFLLNVVLTTDCLDKENSVFTALPSGQIMEFQELFVYSDKINCPIFRIPELPFHLLITDQIMEVYYSNQLKGITLTDEEFVAEEN
ncbi:imm11 family protein [Apibacter sp. HY039]|uniref:imm11 family protein n=1 Tax=Apibacter sp. HY039 TaxID=2501476 RepID=UPI000FEB6E77|nr:DUF1629 domain-containing protein [Apibacter sp. HY039]